ncbi:MAG: malate dehydrogenase [Candidatus Zambryskibacteria bacterium RIFCSPLOWO2_02_39_10]|uniref:Malate dehydrogenase n=2 Tax=Candidatus Zambryskiibacteriota TaxID=1817925 RepID=A0A1G2T9Y1_9BACT|nr:MAG: malate dehydrogenase [Candidatus Zambryskibacteria bacterium RIFCSPHIGHO2_02_38_10.5]OHB07586.1 MAG: malate dehydrogenase [Candidatus Zambryskibacteria bacterium RIFCSPLOWO2_02_39_10]OHB11815.1 MAG: malate dehydrogenase [Candidatus Zambryskibacteria bacterium RIFCSPLOWO2_12_39_8]
MNYLKLSLDLHKKMKGVLAVQSKVPIRNRQDLSIAYTPGVAEVSRTIAKNKKLVYDYTLKSNAVAVITDGSAVLGLGNIGPEAALPVMEGKAVLFKEFADIDAYPIALATQDTEEIIKTIKNISVGFGGINLEDISAPRCFEIEERLKKELDIPVMHDDQHGTAIVVLAALINGLKVVKKKAGKAKIVINGAGAAAMAITNLLLQYGVSGKNVLMLDTHGIIYKGRNNLNPYKEKIATKTNPQKIKGGLENAVRNTDVFIGVSVANVLKPEWIKTMADDPIVFAMANPNPEISPETVQGTKIKVFGTGRSDYPNQINNVLVFPGIFRGALDSGAKQITDKMKIASALAIASLISKKDLSADYIIPSPFDKRVAHAVANAVANAVTNIMKKS